MAGELVTRLLENLLEAVARLLQAALQRSGTEVELARDVVRIKVYYYKRGYREAEVDTLVTRAKIALAEGQILLGENLALLPAFADGSFQLIYIDPPFNTGKVQVRRTLRVVGDADGERTGFGGRRYRSRVKVCS